MQNETVNVILSDLKGISPLGMSKKKLININPYGLTPEKS